MARETIDGEKELSIVPGYHRIDDGMAISQEIVDRLNELLEAERAGVELAVELARVSSKRYAEGELKKFREDEAWAATGLRRAILEYGGKPSERIGDFAQKVLALPTEGERLKLLARGQMWVVKRIDLLLSMGLDPETAALLAKMREEHLENIRACHRRAAELAAPPSPPYRGLLYAHLREAHDCLYYGPWRSSFATDRDLHRAADQLEDYLEALRREVEVSGDPDAKAYLAKAFEAFSRATGKERILNLDRALSYAHHALNCLLHRQGAPNHDPLDFEFFAYDIGGLISSHVYLSA